MPETTPAAVQERAVLAFGTHWVKYTRPTLLYLLLFPISMGFFFFARTNVTGSGAIASSFFLGALLLLVLIHHWYFHRILSEAMVDVIVTNRRVIFCQDSLLLYDDMHEFTIHNLIAVQAQKHGLMQNLLRYGSLWLDTGGSSTEDSSGFIPLVPHPHNVAREITAIHNMK